MTNGNIFKILENTLPKFNLAIKLIISVIRIVVMIRYISPMIRKGITNMKGDPIRTKGWNLFNIDFSFICLKGSVDSNFINLEVVFNRSYYFIYP